LEHADLDGDADGDDGGNDENDESDGDEHENWYVMNGVDG